MTETECPTCGRDDFKNRQGMKSHHAKVHGESIAKEPVECDYCGETTYKHPSRIERQDRHFCDHDCYGNFMDEQPPEESNRWNGGDVETVCEWCDDTFKARRHRVESAEKNFCGPSCHGKWRSENNVGEAHPLWAGEPVEVLCENCGEPKNVRPSLAERQERHFCGTECYAEWFSENIRGENHPLYKGGKPNYGRGWNEAKREAVRERDDRECQHCGRSEAEHIELFGCKHPVHHIQKADSFDDPDRRNAMENLITLCRGHCHQTWERMSPLRPVV